MDEPSQFSSPNGPNNQESSALGGNRHQHMAAIAANFSKAESDPDFAAHLEALGLRLYAGVVFMESREALGRIFSDYEQRYEGPAGTTPQDLTTAREDLTALLDDLRERVEIPALGDGESAASQAIELLKQVAASTDEADLPQLADLMNQAEPSQSANTIRQHIHDIRAGVTEELWELVTFFREEAHQFPSGIPKPTQRELHEEFMLAKDFANRELNKMLQEDPAQPEAEPSPAGGQGAWQ